MPVRDLIYHIKELPARGEKVRAEQFDEIIGGNALNAAIGIVRLGGRALFSGPMGDASETSSQYIFEELAKEGIDCNVVRMPGPERRSSNVMIDPSGERTIVTYRDPNLWNVRCPTPTSCWRLRGRARGEPLRRLCHRALCRSERRKIPVVLDADVVMSMREGLLTVASHIIFSAEALTATAGTQNLEDALRRIAEVTDGFLAVTRGAQGMMWLDPAGRIQTMPTFPGPYGRYARRRRHLPRRLRAGDHRGHGRSPQAMRFASAAAALKCTRHGGAFAAPDRAEVE